MIPNGLVVTVIFYQRATDALPFTHSLQQPDFLTLKKWIISAVSINAGGHPEIVTPGVEASTGALGHGMPIGFGMAIAMRNKKLMHKFMFM